MDENFQKNDSCLSMKNLPANFKHLHDNCCVYVNEYCGVPRVHICEYDASNEDEFFPMRYGVTFYYREWIFMCDILDEIKHFPHYSWNHGWKMDDFTKSAFNITVSILKDTTTDSYSLYIVKKIPTKRGMTISSQITLNPEQWKVLCKSYIEIKKILIETELSLKIKSHCLPLLPLQSVPSRAFRIANKAFQFVLQRELLKVLKDNRKVPRTCIITEKELHSAVISIDISEVLNKTGDMEDIELSPEHINVSGLITNLELLYACHEEDECCL